MNQPNWINVEEVMHHTSSKGQDVLYSSPGNFEKQLHLHRPPKIMFLH